MGRGLLCTIKRMRPLSALVLAALVLAASAAGAACPVKGAGELLQEFFDGGRPDDYQVELLLATVPERDFGFDGAFDAIRSALERSGYLQDRQSLPPGFTVAIDGGKDADPACREERPGVVLFRDRKGRRLLILSLVAETPTAGIYKGAFRRALADVEGLLDLRRGAVRVLGPTFSGSAPSLWLLLRGFPALRFRVISGSATDQDIQALIEHDMPNVSFHATVLPDRVLAERFYAYLHRSLRVAGEDVALIVESSTDYGQAVRESLKTVAPEVRPRLLLNVPLRIADLEGEKDRDRARTAQQRLAAVLSTIFAEKIRYVGLVGTDVRDKRFLAREVRRYCPDVVLFTFESELLYTNPDDRSFLGGMLVVSTYPLFTRNQLWSFPFKGFQERRQFAHGADQGTFNAVVALLDRPELLLEYSRPFLYERRGAAADLRPPVWISAVGIDALFPLAALSNYDDGGFLYRPEEPPPEQRTFRPPYSPFEQGALTLSLFLLGLFCLASCFFYFARFYSEPPKDPKDERHYFWGRFFEVYWPCSLPDEDPTPEKLICERELLRQLEYFAFGFLPLWLSHLFLTVLQFVELRRENFRVPWQWHDWWRAPPFAVFGAVGVFWLSATLLDILMNVLVPGRWRELQLRRLRWRARAPAAHAAAALVLTLAGGLLLAALLWLLVNRFQADSSKLLFLRRSAQPGYGLSPGVPLLILCLLIHLWGYQNLKRIRLLKRLLWLSPDLARELCLGAQVSREVQSIETFLESPDRPRIAIYTASIVLLMATAFSGVVTLEWWPIHHLFRLLLAAAVFFLLYSCLRFLLLWTHFRHFLHLLGHHKMVNAFDRMPNKLARSLGVQFLEELPELTRLEAMKRHWRLLANHLAQLDLGVLGDKGDTGAMARELRALLALADSLPAERRAETGSMRQASLLLMKVLNTFWYGRPLRGSIRADAPVPEAERSGTTNTAELYTSRLPDALHLWLRLAEDFIAIQVVTYISRLFPHLRNYLTFVTAGLLLLLLAVNTYPFQPHHLLMMMLWVMILAVVALAVWVLVQSNRDEVLSRVAKSEPGKVTWNRRFIVQLLIYGVLPLLSLLAADFPELRKLIFSWLAPALRALN